MQLNVVKMIFYKLSVLSLLEAAMDIVFPPGYFVAIKPNEHDLLSAVAHPSPGPAEAGKKKHHVGRNNCFQSGWLSTPCVLKTVD